MKTLINSNSSSIINIVFAKRNFISITDISDFILKYLTIILNVNKIPDDIICNVNHRISDKYRNIIFKYIDTYVLNEFDKLKIETRIYKILKFYLIY